MKKYLITLLAVCIMFTGCGVSKETQNKGQKKESTKIESTELQEKEILDESTSKSVGENSLEKNDNKPKKTHPISSAGEEIEIDLNLNTPDDNELNSSEPNDNNVSSTTYSMISSTNVMSEDAGHDGAIPPTLELKDDMTFSLNHNSTENIIGTYEKIDNIITCTNNSDKYVFIDNGDGTLNYNAKESTEIEKKNENEYEMKDGSLFFSN